MSDDPYETPPPGIIYLSDEGALILSDPSPHKPEDLIAYVPKEDAAKLFTEVVRMRVIVAAMLQFQSSSAGMAEARKVAKLERTDELIEDYKELLGA